MDQLASYNDIDFANLMYKYHPDDNSLRCENNIVYYQGETTFFAGRCGVQKGECVNLGYFRVGLIDIPIWRLEPAALFFLIREYVNSIYTITNIDNDINSIDAIVKKSSLEKEENNLLDSFMDYYNSLKMFKPYLREELQENFGKISTWINGLISGTALVTPGYKLVNDKFFEFAKANTSDEQKDNSGGNGVARTHHNKAFKTQPTNVSNYYDASEYEPNLLSNEAFVNLITIIFLLIATTAVVLTLIFL